MTELLLGLDLGSSMTKGALFDEDGREVLTASRPMPTERPRPGWSEADPDVLWRNVVSICRELAGSEAARQQGIAALGISGAMVGAWVIDASGSPLRPGILWSDGRAQAQIDEAERRTPGFMSEVFQSSGSVMQQGCTLPLVRWLLDYEPEVMQRARAVIGAKDFVRLRLTGNLATDPTEAAVAPGSAMTRDRSPAMMELFGLSSAARLFPEVLPSEAPAGAVTRKSAEETGLEAGTPVAIGTGDVAASVLGAGGSKPGTAVTVLGTTCLSGVVTAAPLFLPPDLGLLFTLPGDHWFRAMVNVAGTVNLDWCLSTLCPDLDGPDRFARLEALASEAGTGAQGATYVPYLSEVGIIAPRVEPRVRAGFSGLTPAHRRAHLVRAVYEGMMFAIRDCYSVMEQPISEVRLVGGASRSRFWTQMLADVTGVPVVVPEGTEFGAKGAALLAAVSIGRFGSVREAVAASSSISRRHEPDLENHALYEAAFERYRAAADGMIDIARRERAT
ncbi:xylulokinase/erythritol kinase [Faunimonas pinastri]|uniref:Xylulokinase/erythritol kinase n=1 Tax=Faunimonas pinastri TaxID=1855383 RepID=A0A1H9Q2Q2_9HYPH|nr:FGGY-family carbohydrate kinase [Faunimonas pinastri]SER54153.1 xylulokinase/erythritol kinase [Faunimonas pinastri]